jgi:hypothetical protein
MNVEVYPKDWTPFCLSEKEHPVYMLIINDRNEGSYIDVRVSINQLKELRDLIDFKLNEIAKLHPSKPCKFLVEKDNLGGLQWKECSQGIDLADFNSCYQCNQYSPV